ncbi:MAG: NAD(P)H-dependent oxidoreductase subunit E [Ignavibacteriaceae bacterium]|nr:NAD(P)H-dependent oxidoreductase subunit E [Ignavibacteriaceae bacterium]
MEFHFSEENLSKLSGVFSKYPNKKAAVMPVLYIAQEQNGYISNEVISEVSKVCEITEEEVMGVVTFYTMYHQTKPGKYHIQVCTNVSCMLRDGFEIYDAVKEKLGISNHGVTGDGLFSLEEVECMGSCGTAPMIAVNEDFHENLTKELTLQILDNLKQV